jgi:hypothetical protein
MWRSFVTAALVASTTLLPGATPASSAAPPPPDPFTLAATMSTNSGVGRITTPGRPCGEGGDGAYWHYDYGSTLPGGTFANEPSELRFHMDLHSDVVTQAQPGVAQVTHGPSAFLLGEESHASLINKRGTIKVRLKSGTCASPSIDFDGTNATGAGTWVVGDTAGAYREATGNGTFAMAGQVSPGADNTGSLALNGTLNILKPSLKVEVVGTYWGFMGLDYALRRPTVIYKITNEGPGDAFGVRLVSATTPTAGAAALGPVPQKLGDLLKGESETVRIRFQLSVLTANVNVGPTTYVNISLQPCHLVVLNCTFRSTLGVEMPDALDRATTYTGTVDATAPAFPPPL